MRKSKLSYQEKARLVELYPCMSNSELALLFGVKESTISNIAFKMRLLKSESFKRERSSIGWFKKGQIPPNKGKKINEFMSPDTQERFLKNSFTPGNRPKNTAAVGSEVITKDGYIKVKIAQPNKWKLKHRLVWEQNNGRIPVGLNVQFRDKNKQNCSINNLYLISRSEQIHKNSIMRYPEELRKAIHNIRVINKSVAKLKNKS
jgi:hypothetical protein